MLFLSGKGGKSIAWELFQSLDKFSMYENGVVLDRTTKLWFPYYGNLKLICNHYIKSNVFYFVKLLPNKDASFMMIYIKPPNLHKHGIFRIDYETISIQTLLKHNGLCFLVHVGFV